MMPPGHLGAAAIAATIRRRHRAVAWGWLLLGAYLPDLIDKPLWALGVIPGTRGPGHAPVVWGVVAAVVWTRVTAPAARDLLLGAASHLVADLAEGVVLTTVHGGEVVGAWLVWPIPERAMPVWVLPSAVPMHPASRWVLDGLTLVASLGMVRRARSRTDAPADL